MTTVQIAKILGVGTAVMTLPALLAILVALSIFAIYSPFSSLLVVLLPMGALAFTAGFKLLAFYNHIRRKDADFYHSNWWYLSIGFNAALAVPYLLIMVLVARSVFSGGLYIVYILPTLPTIWVSVAVVLSIAALIRSRVRRNL